MPLEPPAGRSTVEDLGTLLRISIPSRKQRFMMVFWALWLCGWLFGEVSAAGLLFQIVLPSEGPASVGAPGGFIAFWLLLWTLGGAYATYILAWQLAGKEVVEASSDILAIRRTALGLGRPQEYASEHIARLRPDIALGAPASGWYVLSYWGPQGRNRGRLAFDYGARTVHFAGGVDEAEARQILEILLNRFPAYRGIDEKEAAP